MAMIMVTSMVMSMAMSMAMKIMVMSMVMSMKVREFTPSQIHRLLIFKVVLMLMVAW